MCPFIIDSWVESNDNKYILLMFIINIYLLKKCFRYIFNNKGFISSTAAITIVFCLLRNTFL